MTRLSAVCAELLGDTVNPRLSRMFVFLAIVFLLTRCRGFTQVPEKPLPRFTLAISLFLPYGAPSGPGQPYIRDLKIVETNASNEPIQEAGCWERQGIFQVTVFFNGSLLKEKDRAARLEREAKARAHPCKVPISDAVIEPGKTWTRYLPLSVDYPMTEPGTYEITVSRESDLEHPDRRVTVRSNTVTVVVP